MDQGSRGGLRGQSRQNYGIGGNSESLKAIGRAFGKPSATSSPTQLFRQSGQESSKE